MSGRTIGIYAANVKHGEQISLESVQLKTGKGIVGDRFFGLRPKHPGRNLTLIEAEVIANFNLIYQQTIPLQATRRNLITEGLRLNDLIGKTFQVGEVLCRGIELCEPCKVMARQMSCTDLSQTEIIQAFAYHGGIRAAVLSDGIIKIGDNIAITTLL